MSYNATYPEVYIPKEITSILSSRPNLPEQPKKPVEPSKPNDPGEYDSGGNRGCFGFILVAIIIGFFVVIANERYDIIIYIIPMFFCALFLFKTTTWDKESHDKKRTAFKKDLSEYPSKLIRYKAELSSYEKALDEYNARKETILSMSNVHSYRKLLISNYIANCTELNFSLCPEDETAKKGASETYFLKYLLDNFDSVYTNHRVSVGKCYYYPDFIIEEENLTFDIEIDEPYSGNDGKPIHYIDSKYGFSFSCIDEERNEWFTNNKWIVIRFAEEQIFRNPQLCVDFIKNFIKTLKNAEVKSHIDSGFSVKKWTKEQAHQYAYRRFRHSYVPKKYQRYIDIEEYNKFEPEGRLNYESEDLQDFSDEY